MTELVSDRARFELGIVLLWNFQSNEEVITLESDKCNDEACLGTEESEKRDLIQVLGVKKGILGLVVLEFNIKLWT